MLQGPNDVTWLKSAGIYNFKERAGQTSRKLYPLPEQFFIPVNAAKIDIRTMLSYRITLVSGFLCLNLVHRRYGKYWHTLQISSSPSE
jgi:CRISPR/Cas system CMR-associated protein Cmr1 (group 7 of RAMP superfamily)